ncbi:acyltransferase family protein [Clostridium ihumii]|uniref:acyltransferase family protein n=1 Tax=Clostridium ihumii TaxID=1470356 RepID=UPI000683F5C9|nr:acyltransferase [Clostridium ihumii]
MEKLFTKDKINLGRQNELDLAKGLAIIFMILVHTNEVFLAPKVELGSYNRIIEFIGSPPAAPIFMMLLGAGIIYSKKSDAKTLFKRGIWLFLLGYILNFIRDFIPYTILAKVSGDMSYIQTGWTLWWGNDILPFAGIAFMFFAVIKKLNVKNITLFMLWCVFATLNMFLRGISFENGFVNGFFRLIWGTDTYAWFPFLSWITFPILGYFFAQLLIRCTNKDLFYKNIFMVTAPLSIPLWIYSYINNVKFGAFGELYQTEYYHHDIMGNIVLCTFALFWISLCYFASKHLPKIIQKAMARYSKNCNLMYCVHWILLRYLMLIIEELSCMPAKLLCISIAVFVATDIICITIGKYKTKKRNLKMALS